MKSLIFIIGLPRSGTSFLGEKLKAIDDCVYLEEPNHVWLYKNMRNGHDYLGPEDVTTDKQRYLRNFFYNRAESTIIEKTPSNVLRIRYIYSIFPEAKYIFIRRSIEEVKLSIEKKWVSEDDNNNKLVYHNKSSQKFRQLKIQMRKFFNTPLVDLFYYFPKIFQEISFLIFGRQRSYWGPRIPGYNEISSSLTIREKIDLQVNYCRSKMEADMKIIPQPQVFELDFAHLKTDPELCISKIKEFILS